MKKFRVLCYALVCVVLVSCRHNDNNLSIAFRNSDQYYSMKADFNSRKTPAVEAFMQRVIRPKKSISFHDPMIDEAIVLDDDTKFTIEKSPGFVRIKLDKAENSEASYFKVKSMCDEIKYIVTH